MFKIATGCTSHSLLELSSGFKYSSKSHEVPNFSSINIKALMKPQYLYLKVGFVRRQQSVSDGKIQKMIHTLVQVHTCIKQSHIMVATKMPENKIHE